MKHLFLFIIMLCIVQNLKGQNTWMVKGGLNYSKLYDIDSEGQYGFLLGIEKKIHIWSILSINPELIILGQRTIIKNEPVWTESYDFYLSRYDIQVRRSSYNFSLIFDFKLFESENWYFSTRLFPSYHFDNFNSTEIIEKEKINKDSGNIDWDNYDFEYRQGDFDNYFNFKTGWSLNFSFLFNYGNIVSEIRYMNKLKTIGQAGQLFNVNHKIHSFGLVFGYLF